MTRSRLIGLSLGTILILAAFGVAVWQGAAVFNGAGTALAQGPTASPTPQTTTAPVQKPSGSAGDILQSFWNSLASKLGISVDDLKSKVTDAEKDAIEQAVKDGKVTREQADKLEQNLNSNRPFGPFMFGAFHKGVRRGFQKGVGFGFARGGLNELEAVSAALNLKPSDLVAQLRSGKTLADVAKAQGVDEAKVKQAIIDAAKTQLQRAVQDGVLTQAQADAILARLTPDNIDLSHKYGLFGGGFRLQKPQAQPTPQSQ